MRLQEASAAIGEAIDLDCDTPEELERKAAELERKAETRHHAGSKLERPKRIRIVIKRPTSPAKTAAAEIGGKLENLWKAFDAVSSADQRRFIRDACLRLGFDPLLMALPAAFGLAEEEPDLDENAPAAVAPATNDAAVVQAEPGDDGADLGAEDLQAADDASGDADDGVAEDAAGNFSEAVDPEDFGAEHLHPANDVDEAADQESGGAMKCAYCNIPFESGDQLEEFSGKLYHGLCVEDGKRLAKAKQGKQIAIAA